MRGAEVCATLIGLTAAVLCGERLANAQTVQEICGSPNETVSEGVKEKLNRVHFGNRSLAVRS